MTLNGEINVLTGILSYLLMILVALSSINSIASSLSWSEWRFVQTKLGVCCLAMGLLHDIAMYLRIVVDRNVYNYSTLYLFTRVKLFVIFFPLIVLILKFLFSYFPPIVKKLKKIKEA
jgi:DMSO/TMAO reductase YedYZ heme-binding membrane subunit